MQCEVEGCNREAKTKRFGNLCIMHYKRMSRWGSITVNKNAERQQRKMADNKCKYCDNKIGISGAKGMCSKHYQMFRNHGDALFSDRKIKKLSHGYYRSQRKNRTEPDHRWVLEDYLGRRLLPTEVVHHINFDKTDNRVENLWLYSSKSEHTREHCHYNSIRKSLASNEVIKFKDGVYYKEIV